MKRRIENENDLLGFLLSSLLNNTRKKRSEEKKRNDDIHLYSGEEKKTI
jgi:hypothetical protein